MPHHASPDPFSFLPAAAIPQDFWNVDASDPFVHCDRFFYGPMLQGRDGLGGCPCCGTGKAGIGGLKHHPGRCLILNCYYAAMADEGLTCLSGWNGLDEA